MSDPGRPYLPTMPGTHMKFAAAHRWSACRYSRVLAHLHLWRIRDRHLDRRHPFPELAYIDPPGP